MDVAEARRFLRRWARGDMAWWRRVSHTMERGAVAAEYSFLVALIALVAMVGVGALGQSIRTNLYDVAVSAFR